MRNGRKLQKSRNEGGVLKGKLEALSIQKELTHKGTTVFQIALNEERVRRGKKM